jgi:signal transduction histidine kinase
LNQSLFGQMLKQIRSFTDSWVPPKYLTDNEKLRKSRLVIQSCLWVTVMCLFYVIFYLVVGYNIGVAICTYGGLSAIFGIFYFKRTGSFMISGNFFAFTSLNVITLLTMTSYGLETLTAAWLLIVPISAFLMAGIRSGLFWALLTLAVVGMLFVFELEGIELPAFYGREIIVYINLFALLGLIFFLAMIFLNNEIGKEIVMQKLARANQEIEAKNQEITGINRQLEEKVEQRTRNLQSAKGELDTFLYESSHALRRPLVRIMGLLSLVKSEIDEDEREDFMRLVDITVDNMDTMLRDLLQVSEVYHRKPELAHVNLENETKEVLRRFSEANATFSLDLNAVPDLHTDAELFRILMEKLIENAVMYRKSETAPHQVNIGTRQRGDRLILVIEDNGAGIDPAAMPSLFNMFSRGTEKSRGSGLGLFIVQKILDRLGGDITVESIPEKFARFEVALPLNPELTE